MFALFQFFNRSFLYSHIRSC